MTTDAITVSCDCGHVVTIPMWLLTTTAVKVNRACFMCVPCGRMLPEHSIATALALADMDAPSDDDGPECASCGSIITTEPHVCTHCDRCGEPLDASTPHVCAS